MRALHFPAISILGMMLVAGAAAARPSYYYGFSEKIAVTPNPRKVHIRYRVEMENPSVRLEKIKSKLNIAKGRVISMRKTSDLGGIISGQDAFSAEEKAAIAGTPDVEASMDVLETIEGTELSYQDKICLKFKQEVMPADSRKILAVFGVSTIQDSHFMVVKVRPGDDAMEVANAIFETGKVEYAHPDFFIPKVLNQIPNDTYFGMQWNFRNVGQTINDGHVGTPGADIMAVDAWRGARGANVIVAVLDEGVTSNHPDLPNTRQIRLAGSNFDLGNNDPSPAGNNNHGNACAGLVSAEINNGVGTAGIAPRARIMPIRMMSASDAATANAIDFAWQNGAQVLSCSWGYGSTNPNLVPAIVDAINRATTQGRGGRGSVVVFAAGNTAHHVAGNHGTINFPANVAGVITVGASDRNDRQANYSPTSPANGKFLDIVAPSHRAYPNQIAGENFEVWTTDIPGTPGYNPNASNGEQVPASNTSATWNNYTGRFGGTSAACPQVAGTAALILGFEPGLRRIEVYNILINTADKVGPYTYTSGRSGEMGFGRLNALRAMRKAFPMTPFMSLAVN